MSNKGARPDQQGRKTQKPKARASSAAASYELALIALSEVAPLPGLIIPLYVTERQRLLALSYALERDEPILLVLQIGSEEDKVSANTIAKVAGLANIVQSVRLSSGHIQVSLHVQQRVRIEALHQRKGIVTATVEAAPTARRITLSADLEKRIETLKQTMRALSEFDESLQEHLESLEQMYDPGGLADFVGSILPLKPAEAQRILDQFNPRKRFEMSHQLAEAHLNTLRVRSRIAVQARSELEQAEQKELLREQLRVIRAELGEEDVDEELVEFKERLKSRELPSSLRLVLDKQMRRLQRLHPDSAEAALARTYLDWVLDMPWGVRTDDNVSLAHARAVLEEEHYGLEPTKERVLDFLGVRALKKTGRGPILLLVGPPGVGKTSLGKSIARALGRKFVRVALGGLRDEAELRGHRRTYVGALPGRIIQGLRTAGSMNPVLMLDELDKIGSDFRGDPSAVLLEILDSEQNEAFEDHYLNMPINLSEVLFIATANVTDTIPAPLLDRMELVELSGYTDREKLQIAKRYLIPREQAEHGLSNVHISLSDKTLLHLINGYTRESGVRQLGRVVAAIFRKLARLVAEGKTPPSKVSPRLAQKLLGSVRFVPEKRLKQDETGIAVGLAWTSTGGELLLVEVSKTAGKGQLSLTGQLGEVMQESARTALTFVLSRAERFALDPAIYESINLHVHVPQGAIPKDGPSAGVAIAVAMLSALSNRLVSCAVAMTGELTLRGSVLPVGGMREKILAAHRAGLSTVIIPKGNERELRELPAYLRTEVQFVAVETIEEVFAVALRLQFDGAPRKVPAPKKKFSSPAQNIRGRHLPPIVK